ncbi:hypothetical protein F511_33665 [Dorcoceras hygrometricum]|uniref:Uncharacterized protein n=1 Tax=Dorcoceras hygrometricum TaxID=472368 RepID=A0A2Z7A188_9LAMI|nr:hypothetical protein F511_33665 [Dorcoceras hygrometricum]
MGDRTHPEGDQFVTPSLEPKVPELKAPDLRRSADFLLDNVRIGNHRTHYDKYRRYVNLQVNAMFTACAGLFEAIFKSQWQHFRRFMDSFPLHAAFNERDFEEVIPYSTEYDAFLTQLNSSIRPTHIKLTPEDSLYIPVLADNPQGTYAEANLNPFNIENFVLNHDLFYGLLQIMKERCQWKIKKIQLTPSDDLVGCLTGTKILKSAPIDSTELCPTNELPSSRIIRSGDRVASRRGVLDFLYCNDLRPQTLVKGRREISRRRPSDA